MTKANFYTHVTATFGFRESGGRCRADHLMWPCPQCDKYAEARRFDNLTHLPHDLHEVEYTATPASAQRMYEGSQNM